ncbi:MAG TPA: 4Fe-4S binding protein [Methanoregulaceae archaeon]|nr:4Fe-4S binding protein [Methanoregulaceae archaeon]
MSHGWRRTLTDNWALPTIDLARCTGCGACVTYCPTRAVEMSHGRPRIVRIADCTYCGECEQACPEGAIGLGYKIVLPAPKKRGRRSPRKLT